MSRQVAVVTGTSSGFGLLISVELAKAGYLVVATMRDTGRQERLLQAVREAGVSESVEVKQLDVTDEVQVQAVAGEVGEKYGRVDVLVNNAGLAVGGYAEEVSLAEWRRQMETNLFGVVAVTQAVLPWMRRQRSGKIINMSSVSGLIGFPAMGPYVSSKYALEGYSESLRVEMLLYGVYVSLVEPGSYKTEIWEKSLYDFKVEEGSPYAGPLRKVEQMVNESARDGGDPQEVAELVVKIARSARPKLRYPVGKGVKMMALVKRLLPFGVVERVVVKRLKD